MISTCGPFQNRIVVSTLLRVAAVGGAGDEVSRGCVVGAVSLFGGVVAERDREHRLADPWAVRSEHVAALFNEAQVASSLTS